MNTSLALTTLLAATLAAPLTSHAQDQVRCAGNLFGVAGVSLNAQRVASGDQAPDVVGVASFPVHGALPMVGGEPFDGGSRRGFLAPRRCGRPSARE